MDFATFTIEKQKIVTYLKSKEIEGLSWTAIWSGAFFHWVRALLCIIFRQAYLESKLSITKCPKKTSVTGARTGQWYSGRGGHE
ncbi:hypothetical protein V1508DRAFT_413571 [Lipomyces doorenjongii]|uniref:uncharacterized protein n=1 Tax=Lipomyces doorenjongii TaxID=383834 RepID=UPI0034CD7E69